VVWRYRVLCDIQNHGSKKQTIKIAIIRIIKKWNIQRSEWPVYTKLIFVFIHRVAMRYLPNTLKSKHHSLIFVSTNIGRVTAVPYWSKIHWAGQSSYAQCRFVSLEHAYRGFEHRSNLCSALFWVGWSIPGPRNSTVRFRIHSFRINSKSEEPREFNPIVLRHIAFPHVRLVPWTCPYAKTTGIGGARLKNVQIKIFLK
jgi:hypothetical protein